MMLRRREGWSLVLADLSLILFIVTAKWVGGGEDVKGAVVEAPVVQGIYERARGGPSVAQWLSAQQAGPNARVTVTAGYGPGGAGQSIAEAQALMQEAEAAGAMPVLVIVPGKSPPRIELSYDQGEQVGEDAQARLARGLHDG